MKSTRWHALMNRLGFGANTETYRALLDAYSQKHRHYHTAAHIAHCLDELAPCRELAEHPDDVELALWFHDAVYDSYAKDNEQKSADWAARFLREKRAGNEQIDRVHGLVMATVHEAPADGSDAQLLVDIDLSILGADETTYRQFEQDVRREYKWVPGPLFRRTRRKILQSFLDRQSIYSTAAFRNRLEEPARRNLVAAIKTLGGSAG